MLNKIVGLCSTLLFATVFVFAQTPTMADLKEIVGKLKVLKTYSYETRTNVVFPDGTKETQTTSLYMDGPNKRLCYKNGDYLLLLTKQWAFKADHDSRNVSVFDVVKYNKRYKDALPEADVIFRTNIAAMFMDSVLVKEGKLSQAKRTGSKSTFTLSFQPDSYIKQVVIVYDHAKELPESVYVKTFFEGPTKNGKKTGTLMESTSAQYNASVPEATFDAGRYFTVRGGKPVLVQYKNYKVTAIL